MKDSFMISIVIPVYNTVDYLPETMESLFRQTIGFENLQVILSDDGSTDGSGELCDRYAAEHPENVIALHHENRGVSHAKNYGKKSAVGKYVNFLDSDDYFADDFCEKAYTFFEAHYDETDMVTCPHEFFDARTGEHWTNYIFKEGSRVIDLEKEYCTACTFTNASFFKREQAMAFDFDEEMASGEDLKYVLEVMLGCGSIGVVADTVYMYRRRGNGQKSLVQSESNSPKIFTSNLNHLVMYFLDQYEANEPIPRFLQYNLLSFLQWRLMEVNHVIEALGEEEGAVYYRHVLDILGRFDDEIILGQKKLTWVHFYNVFRHKYGPDFCWKRKGDKIFAMAGNTCVKDMSRVQLNLELMEYQDGVLYLSLVYPDMDDPAFSLLLTVKYNGKIYEGEEVPDPKEIRDPIAVYGHKKRMDFHIPLGEVKEKEEICFLYTAKAGAVTCEKLRVTRLTPFMAASRYEYVIYDDYMLTHPLNHMYVEKSSPLKQKKQEELFRLAIKKKIFDGIRKKKGYLKTQDYRDFRDTLKLRREYFRRRKKKKKEVWLLTDRPSAAGDNGEALFRYLCKNKPEDVDVYFALSEDAKEFETLSKLGNVLRYRSKEHILIHMLADKIISSQADEFVRDICWGTSMKLRDVYRARQVFLQHGITKDDISGWLNRYNKNLKLFVTAGRAEYESILEGNYGYDENTVVLTGFPRFDRLDQGHKTEKTILLMPTWRQYISSKLDIKTGTWAYNVSLKETEFFRRYEQTLTDPELLDMLRDRGYRILLVLHPAMRTNASDFPESDVVSIAAEGVSYRELFESSAMLLTDYSSTAFDFAYLGKPVLYYQFDEEEFFANHTYKKGYWDYREMGFGKVCTGFDELKEEIARLLSADCKQQEEYGSRVDAFFAYRDKENCARVYERICSLS